MESRSLQFISEACQGKLLGGSPPVMIRRICTDSRHAGLGDLFFALSGEHFDGHAFLDEVSKRGVAAVVAQEGRLPEGFAGCPVILVSDSPRAALGRLAARYRRDFETPIVVIGGSNGKTTTKELVASVLRQTGNVLWNEASFNNDIGVPVTLLRLEASQQAAVVEAGTNHPGELAPLLEMIAPHFGVITNIGREHLEFFKDLAGVALEEGTIAEALPSTGVLFLNGDSEWADTLAARSRAQVVRVGLGPDNQFRAEKVRFSENGVQFTVTCPRSEINGAYQIKLLGRHQVVNALFAVAVGAELGLSRKQIECGLAECAAPKMRLQYWNLEGLGLLDDSYNANTDSMLAALDTLRDMPCRGRRIAVLGDMGEQGEASLAGHLEVGKCVAAGGVDHLFVVGAWASHIAAAARRGGMGNVSQFSDADAAAAAVAEFARVGDLVLVKASRSMRLERVCDLLKNGAATAVKKTGC